MICNITTSHQKISPGRALFWLCMLKGSEDPVNPLISLDFQGIPSPTNIVHFFTFRQLAGIWDTGMPVAEEAPKRATTRLEKNH